MNTASEIIYLNNVLQRLCKLYLALQEKPHEEETIQEIRTKIIFLYSELMDIKKATSSKS
jgi:hypothetical protein